MSLSPRERSFDLLGLEIAVLEWGGEAGDRRVLALHGWLDNAASFQCLAGYLPGCHLVAPDLPGHGRSQAKPASATYHLWDELPLLDALLDALGWRDCYLLGHSRGGMMAVLMAAALPERIRGLVLLDATMPAPVEPEDSPAQLARFLVDTRRHAGRQGQPRRYAGRAEALEARIRRGVSPAVAAQLAERSLCEGGQGVWWSSDPRIGGASAFKLTQAHNAAMLGALRSPVLLALAGQGLGALPEVEQGFAAVADLTLARFPGDHHFHMVDAGASALGTAITAFMTEDTHPCVD